jgi:hypothetical protein
MKHKLFFAMLAVLIGCGLAGCVKSSDTTTTETLDVSLHDNWVYFEPNGCNPSLSFTLSDHDVSSGQPWSGVSTGTPDQWWGIDVRAGRHKTSGPASWFKARASVATCTADESGNFASELNFAITGTLTIAGTGYPITIGQGSFTTQNNWWVGGPGWTIHPGVGGNVVTPDGKWYIEPIDNTSDQFWIRTSY